MKKQPQDLKTLINEAGNLPNLAERSELLLRLNNQVKQILSPSLAGQIKVANLRQTILIIETTTAVWAARVNFEKKQLLTKLQQQALPMLTAIEVKVNPSLASVQTQPIVNHRQLSKTAAGHINALADHIDGSLSQKLKRLAALANRKNQT